MKVLLIEDNPADARLIQEMLKEANAAQFELTHVERLYEAFQRLDKEAFDVMLLDLNLPDSQGLDTFFRACTQVPTEMPIVVLTGLADEVIGVEAITRGAQDYLIKGQADSNLLVRALRYAIERKRAEEALQQYTQRLKTLREIDQAILEARSPEEIAQATLRHVRQLVPCQRASVGVFDVEANESIVLAAHVNGETRVEKGTRIPLEKSRYIQDLQRGEVVVLEDIQTFSSLVPAGQDLRDEGLRAYIMVPLISQGELIGSFNLAADSPGAFNEEHIEIAHEIAGQLAVALQQARLHEQVQRHAEELEQRVAERTAELQASEEKSRAQYKGIPVPTYTWQRMGEDLVLVDYNDAAAAFTRGKIADWVGIKASEMYQDLPEILEELSRCFAEKTTIEREMTYRLKSTNESKHLAVKYAFVPPDLVLVHTEDIAERKEMQERLVRSEKLATLGQLAGGVGHELRNPLGAIKNAAYFLNMVLEEPKPEVKETLEILEKEVAISERIISSLLDFARAKPPTRRKVDINDVVREALSRTTVPENVEVISQLNESLPTILADPTQLGQAFKNIILNAIQAMTSSSPRPEARPEGSAETPEGGRLVVKTSEVSEKLPKSRWVVISFTDTGVGVPGENLEKVFEPLFTTKAKGIGLGLAITRTLVEEHGGSIEVESKVGKGTTFTVRLPLAMNG